jgi:mono/diheme cytochrome c family protein
MTIARVLVSIAGVAAVSLALAACGGKTGGTTTVATEAPRGQTTVTTEETAPAKERTATEETTTERTTTEPEEGGQANAAVKQGEQVFTANGCGSCHTLAAAGTESTVGPNLDETLEGQSKAFIREAIVDPDAEVAAGYGAGIMPPNFGSVLSSSELEALVTYLQQ